MMTKDEAAQAMHHLEAARPYIHFTLEQAYPHIWRVVAWLSQCRCNIDTQLDVSLFTRAYPSVAPTEG